LEYRMLKIILSDMVLRAVSPQSHRGHRVGFLVSPRRHGGHGENPGVDLGLHKEIKTLTQRAAGKSTINKLFLVNT